MIKYDLFFNSSASNAIYYSKGDNISLIEISNSDQEYYQSGRVILYNVPSAQTIGDTVDIYIDGALQFSGYVSSRQRESKGVIQDTYSLLGRTYDLWRYHTNADTTYSNRTSTYIASSLVGNFCSITVDDEMYLNSGSIITGEIEFSNEIIGDALIRLSKLDGYRFYVDENDEFHYEPYSDSVNIVNIEEGDILEMQPIEEDDSDINNDIMVIGGSDYSKVDSQTSHPSSEVICDGILYAQKFKASDPRLSAFKLYLNRTLDPLQPDALTFEIWENTEKLVFSDEFDNWIYLNSGNNSYNMQISGGYLCLAHDGSNYKTSGQIESICYSGQYLEERTGYVCQYMKVDLYNVVSSNRIYISGTNASGAYWSGLSDGKWENLGYEDYAVKVRYKLSSNGTYTPKIGRADLSISDASSGFDQTVYTDTFTNLSKVSSASLSNLIRSKTWMSNIDANIVNNCLVLSGLRVRNTDYPNGDTVSNSGYWASTPSGMYDNNNSTYAQTVNGYGNDYNIYDSIKFNEAPITVIGFKQYHDITDWIDEYYVQISSNLSTWTSEFSAIRLIGGEHGPHYEWTTEYDCPIDTYQLFSDGFFHSGTMSLRTHIHHLEQYFMFYDFRAITIPNEGLTYGTVKSLGYDLGDLVYSYIKIDVDEHLPHCIAYSGSLNGGYDWQSLTKNQWTTMTAPATGNNLVVSYHIKPSGSYGYRSGIAHFPNIRSITAKVRAVQEGGLPKSGTKIEWSDDNTITSSEIPYPPSYSSWQTYSDPKLRLTEDNYYWYILEHASGSSEYWTYYYDGDSTFDGNIAYSLDDGVTWSSHASNPTQVPNGSMAFKLGWKEGEIVATSSNATSIATYGRHFKKITDTNITTFEEANYRAMAEASDSNTIPKKGSMVINGITDIALNYSLSSNLVNFGVYEKMDIVSYIQKIDGRGFTTTINYGKPPFDIGKEIANLKRELT